LEEKGKRNRAVLYALCIEERDRNHSINRERERKRKLEQELHDLPAFQERKMHEIQGRDDALHQKKRDNDNFIQATLSIQQLSQMMLEEVQAAVNQRIAVQKERTIDVLIEIYSIFYQNWWLVEKEIHALFMSINDLKERLDKIQIKKKAAVRLKHYKKVEAYNAKIVEINKDIEDKSKERDDLGKISFGLEQEFDQVKVIALQTGVGTQIELETGEFLVEITKGEGEAASVTQLIHPRPEFTKFAAIEDAEFYQDVADHLRKQEENALSKKELALKTRDQSSQLSLTFLNASATGGGFPNT